MYLARVKRRVAPVSNHDLLVICMTEYVAIVYRPPRVLVDKYAAHLPAVDRTFPDNWVGAFADLHVGIGVAEDVTSRDEGRTVLLNLYSYAPIVEDMAIFYCS